MLQSSLLKLFPMALFVFLLLAPQIQAQGEEPQFTISPPPLAYPNYSAPGSTQSKATATYIVISSGGFEMTGYGGSVTTRTVGERTEDDRGQGVSFAGGLFLLSGEGEGLDLSGTVISAMFNVERELTKNEGSNVIGFVGPNFSTTYIGASSDSYDVDIYITAIGFQAGVQYSMDSDNMIISPFAQYTNQFIGSTEVCVSSTYRFDCTEEDIDVTSTSFGFDLLHVPSGVTLSGVLQSAGGDSDSTIIQLSWTFGEAEAGSSNGEEEKAASTRGLINQRTAQAQGYPVQYAN